MSVPDEGKTFVASFLIGLKKVLAVYVPIQPGSAFVAGI
jgi:hypothetical protein